MANLKEIRGRIKSIRSIQQVTKAMNMVAAAKLRKAQERITRLRPYSDKLNEIMARVQKIEGVVANVDVHQFSSIMHALDQLDRSLKNIS